MIKMNTEAGEKWAAFHADSGEQLSDWTCHPAAYAAANRQAEKSGDAFAILREREIQERGLSACLEEIREAIGI